MFLKRINIFLLLFIMIYCGINSLSTVQAARKIDAKFLNFLLSDQDISSYNLKKQYQSSQPVSLTESGEIVSQTWISNDKSTEVLLNICIFDSEEEAIRGMHYYTHTTAELWLWGALFDGILGRHSWRSFNNDKTVLFAYGNIGILIGRYKGNDQKIIPLLADAQMKKIKQNLNPQIIQHRETIRASQLSATEYENHLAEKINIDLNGFTRISSEDSFWLMKGEGLVMGIRREWQDDKGRVVGIDICKLGANEIAAEVASERVNMSNGRVVNAIGALSREGPRSSDVLVSGNVVIHLYSFFKRNSHTSNRSNDYHFN